MPTNELLWFLPLISLVLISWLVVYASLGFFLANCSDWRGRTAASICGLGPVYLAEAYELCIWFVIQVSVVFVFTRLRIRNRREQDQVRSLWQPKIKDLLLVLLVASLVVSVFVQAPEYP